MKKSLLTVLITLAASVSCFAQNNNPQAVTAHSSEPRIFTLEMLNQDIDQDNISITICRKGYTKTVRPSTNYTTRMKLKLLREMGLSDVDSSLYELDHIVPLALGGHPSKQANLMLQLLEGKEGAKQKDRLERKMQNMVCSGEINLSTAQYEIGSNWIFAYKKYVKQK